MEIFFFPLTSISGISKFKFWSWKHLPGNIQGHIGQSFKQRDLEKDVPDHGRGVGPDDL